MTNPLNIRGDHFQPDFSQLVSVLKRKVPDRPTLFEFAFNTRLIQRLSGMNAEKYIGRLDAFKPLINAFRFAGYDYVTISAWRTNTMDFFKGDRQKESSHSLNEGAIIVDRKSFDAYEWPDPESGDFDIYHDIGPLLPDGMKLIPGGNGGLLENVIDLVGFENLSLMTMLDPDLTTEIFDAVGSRLLRFYDIVSSVDTVGACIVNDDWGFKNQTMFSPDALRKWVFPWHKKMVRAIHGNGKYAILHSCGQVQDVMDDIIDDMRYDAKHSFEDEILPVESALEQWGSRIAILGGIDVDFLARSEPDSILARSQSLLKTSQDKGGYALGSGNSIPDYIPDDNFMAMIQSVNRI